MSTHLVISDYHACPNNNNSRALLMGQLMFDLRPDVLVVLGDQCDMASLSSHEKGYKKDTYKADVESVLDAQDKLFHRVRTAKKGRPTTYWFDGNHEDRITRTLAVAPELRGTLDLAHLRLPRTWDEYVPYRGNYPGTKQVDGVDYCHFAVAGVSGRPLGGERHASSLVSKRLTTTVVGHSHLLDYHVKVKTDGSKVMGLSCPCAMDYKASWAGQSGDVWSHGITILHNVEGGVFDLEIVSMNRLEKLYGTRKATT